MTFPSKLMVCAASPAVLDASKQELAWLAQRLACPLVVYHSLSPYCWTHLQEHREWSADQAEAIEAEARDPVFSEVKVSVVCDAEARSLVPGILETADHLSVDLVVLPTHPRRGLHRLGSRSAAEELTRDCRIPVLTFDLERVPGDEASAPFDRVIAPTDLSDLATGALEEAVHLARRVSSPLTVVHALSDLPVAAGPEVIPEELPDWSGADLRRQLESQVEALVGETGVAAEVVIQGGRVVDIVRELAAQHANPLVVMATAGRDSLGDRILGSRTERVIRTAGCSVLSLPPPFLRPRSASRGA